MGRSDQVGAPLQDQPGLPVYSSERGRRRRIGSVAGRHVGKALGGDDGREDNHEIVPEVKKEAGENGPSPSAGKRKNYSDESQEADEAPGITELGSVDEPKERARHQDAGHHAGASGAGEFHPEELENRRGDARQDRIQVAAKDGFLHERRDKYCHGHERQCARAALEELLDGRVFRILDLRTGHENENGQAAAAKEIHPRTASASAGIGLEFLPAERMPEWRVTQDGKRDVQKQKDQGEPKNVGADDEPWIGLQQMLELLLREAPVRRKVSQ